MIVINNSLFFRLSAISLPFLLGLMIYFPVFNYGYVWDDHYFFSDSDFFSHFDLRKIISSSLPLWKENVFYRPLTQLLFALQYAVGMGSASIFHTVSFSIFMANAVLVVAIVFRSIVFKSVGEECGEKTAGKRYFWSCLAGCIYVIHPVTVESVSWISSQFDLQMTFWILLLLYVSTFSKPAWKSLCLSAIFYFCASASKESAVSFLPVFIIFHCLKSTRYKVSRPDVLVWLKRGDWLPDALGVLLGGVVYWLTRHILLDAGVTNMFRGDLIDNLLNALRAIYWYLQVSFLPFYGVGMHFAEGKEYFSVAYLVGGAISVMVIFLLLRFYLALGLILSAFLIALSPALLTTGGGYSSTFINDRYLSYPLAVLLVNLCVLAGSYSSTFRMSGFFSKVVKCVSLILVLFLAFHSSLLVKAWRSDLTLWVYALEANPESGYARGQAVGHYAMNGYCEKATEIAAQRPTSTVAAAVGLIAQCQLKKNPDAAIRDLNAILAHPGALNELDMYSILSALALAHVSLHQYEKSVEIYRDLIDAYPLRYKLRMSLSAALLLACKSVEAEQEYLVAMRSVPEMQKDIWRDFYEKTATEAAAKCAISH